MFQPISLHLIDFIPHHVTKPSKRCVPDYMSNYILRLASNSKEPYCLWTHWAPYIYIYIYIYIHVSILRHRLFWVLACDLLDTRHYHAIIKYKRNFTTFYIWRFPLRQDCRQHGNHHPSFCSTHSKELYLCSSSTAIYCGSKCNDHMIVYHIKTKYVHSIQLFASKCY